MAEIVPAILEKNFSEIKNKLTALRQLTKYVHLDIEDGIFVKESTWPLVQGSRKKLSNAIRCQII